MKIQANKNSQYDSSKNLFSLNNALTNNDSDSNQIECRQNTPNLTQNQADFNIDQTKPLVLSEKDLFNFQEKNSHKCSEEDFFQGNNPSLNLNNFDKINAIQNPNNLTLNDINVNNNNNKDKDNIKVIARIRPRNHKEGENCNLIDVMQNTIRLKNKPEELFIFDFVATEEITQEQMFEKCAREVADNVLQGYNGTIFAYGQTSAGKTYTLIGSRENIHEKMAGLNSMKNLSGGISVGINPISNAIAVQNTSSGGFDAKKYLSFNSEKRGIIPRAIEYILKNTSEKKEENTEISLSCSFLEIYNEELRDLLDEKNAVKRIEIREINENQEEEKQDCNNNNKKSKNYIKSANSNLSKLLEKKNNNEKVQKIINIFNLHKLKFKDYDQAIQYLAQGLEKRKVGETRMNEESSRSHAIFSIYLEIKQRINNNIKTKKSVFHMVDLAGSERQSDTGAVGARLNESGNINNSLMVLRKVLESLEPSKKLNHIPYRDSKLTFALKDSLGGNSKTCIITNISPANSNNSDTLNTLNFGKIARRVKNEAKINEELYVDNAWEQELIQEREKIRKLLSENAKLIQKQKEQKQKYEELYEQYTICLKKVQKQNENQMDICGKDESNEFDPKVVFGVEGENINNNFNNYFYGNSNASSNYIATKFNSKAKNFFNFNNNINRAISDDSTREDYKITYDNCFKELERLQEDLKNKDSLLCEKNEIIERLHLTIMELDASISLSQKEIEKLNQKNLKLSKENLTGDKDLTAVMLQNSEFECEIQKLKEMIKEKEKENQKKSDNQINLEIRFSKKVNSLEERLESKKKELIRIEEENCFRDNRIKDLEAEKEKKDTKITELYEVIDKFEKEKEALRKTIDDKDKFIERKEKEIENLIKQKAEISEKGTKLMESYNERLDKKETEKVKLEEELRKKVLILEELNCLVYNIKDSYRKLNEDYHESKGNNNELVLENKLLKKEKEELKKREKEMIEKIEELNREITDLTKIENSKKNHGKIDYLNKKRSRIEELEAILELMKPKELFLNNLLSKVGLTWKNANKLKPEQLEKTILETEKLKDKYRKCFEKSTEKIERIQFTASTKYGFSYFFHDNRMILGSTQDVDEHFTEKLDTIISFLEFLLKYNKDNQIEINKQGFLLSNLEKWKKINDSTSEDLKEKHNKTSSLQKENDENFNNKNKEPNKRSSIIDSILKLESCSKLKDIKYGTKRKTSQNHLIITPLHLNYKQEDTDNVNLYKPKTPMTLINKNVFPKLDLRCNLTFEKGVKEIEDNKNNFNNERPEASLKNSKGERNVDLNLTDENFLLADNKNQCLNIINIEEKSAFKEGGTKTKFLNPFLMNDSENPSLINVNDPEEKIDDVNKSLDKMDIVS